MNQIERIQYMEQLFDLAKEALEIPFMSLDKYEKTYRVIISIEYYIGMRWKNNCQSSLINSSHNTTFTPIITELTKIDALPCSQIQAAIRNGNGEAYSKKGAFGMSRHIVQAFHGMVIIRFVFFDQVVHDLIQIGTHIGIGIFVDRKCA